MNAADRLFGAALILQIIYWVASLGMSPDGWVLTGVFWACVVLVPVIGFIIGRAGGTSGRAGRVAATLTFTWFFLGLLRGIFSTNVAPSLYLTGVAGFAIACLVGGVVLYIVAVVSAKVGARIGAAA